MGDDSRDRVERSTEMETVVGRAKSGSLDYFKPRVEQVMRGVQRLTLMAKGREFPSGVEVEDTGLEMVVKDKTLS